MRPTAIVLAVLLAGLTACNKTQDQPPTAAAGDPANGNLASAEQAPASPPQNDGNAAAPADAGAYDVAPEADAQVVQAPDPPPPLPDYDQPPCPGDNYLWTPGYWDYASAGYYWVPGAWVIAPWVGSLWTPPWWGYDGGHYLWHAGYWGPHIGFYGGINYGFGYTGRGYYGAYWNGGKIFYNRSITNVNVSVVHNVYNYAVANSHSERISFNGGRGGLEARPTAQETAALRDRRTPPVAAQIQHARDASTNREQFAAGSHPHPGTLAAPHPLATEYRTPAGRPEPRPAAPAASERSRQQPEQPTRQTARPSAPEPTRVQPESHADRMVRPQNPPHPAPQERPTPQSHPTQQEHTVPPPQERPTPQSRPTQPEHIAPPPHAAPQERPAPQSHPAQQEHPAPHQAPAPPPKDKRKGQ